MNDKSDKQVLRRLFDSPYLALAILSKDFCLLEVNDTFARAAGKSVDHFGGKNLFTIYPEKDLPLFERAVRTGECVRSSTEIYAQDFGGGLSYWEWTLDPILDESGNTELLLLTLMEVTKRRKAELALSDTREHLEHLMGSIASGFYALDRNWRFTYLNRAAQEHTRSIVRKDLIGESIWEAFPLLKGTIAEEKFRATMEQGTTCWHSSYLSVRGCFFLAYDGGSGDNRMTCAVDKHMPFMLKGKEKRAKPTLAWQPCSLSPVVIQPR